MKKYAERFYKSKKWQRLRENKFKAAGGLCEACLAKGLIVPGEIVHHLRPITERTIDDPSVTSSMDNLMLLCRECHEHVHRRKPKRYKIDKDGHVIISADDE